MQTVFPQLGCEKRHLVILAIFIVWFLCKPAFASCYLPYMCKFIGGAKKAAVLKQVLLFCGGGA